MRRPSRTLLVLVLTTIPSVDGRGAGGDERSGALNLNQAHAAGADGLNVLQIAQGRDLHACLSGRLKNCGLFRNLDFDVINRQARHFYCSLIQFHRFCRNRNAGSAWLL